MFFSFRTRRKVIDYQPQRARTHHKDFDISYKGMALADRGLQAPNSPSISESIVVPSSVDPHHLVVR